MSARSIIDSMSPCIVRAQLTRITSSPLGYRLAKGVFWTLAGSVISRGLMLLGGVLVARILGRAVFGEFGVVRSTVDMFFVFAGFGLGVTATKHVAEFCNSDPERAGRIINLSERTAAITGGVMAVGLAVFAPWLAERALSAPHLAESLRIGALVLFLSALNSAQTGALSGFEDFKSLAGVNLIVAAISLPILVGGAYIGGLTGAVWALAIGLAVNWSLNRAALTRAASIRGVPLHHRDAHREKGILWAFSVPAVLSGLLFSPVNWACVALLVSQKDGYSEMGLYSAANQWRAAVLFIPSMLAGVALPMLSNLSGAASKPQYRKVLMINLLLTLAVSGTVAFFLVVAAGPIMRAYGPGFCQGADVLRIIALVTTLMAVNSVIGQAIASRGNMWIGLLFNALWAVVILGATYTLVQRGMGALGLAWAMLISYLLHTVWQGVYLIRILCCF